MAEKPRTLPEGWTWASICDVVDSIPNINPKQYPDRQFYYVDISAIDNKTNNIVGHKTFKGAEAPSRARRPIRPGDVLFSTVRTYLRNIAVVPSETKVNIASTGFTVLRSNGTVLPPYLFKYILSQEFIKRITPQQTGTHYPATSDRKVLSELIPLAPLPEQGRLVSKVEELLQRVNASRERLARVPEILKRFRQSVLDAAYSGRLTEDWRENHPDVEPALEAIAETRSKLSKVKTRRGVPKAVDLNDRLKDLELPPTWTLKSVAFLLRSGTLVDVKDGNHGANHPKREEFSDTGLPFIIAAQVHDYHIDYKGAPKLSGRPLERLKVGFAKVGDAILTHKGTVGRAALNSQPCVLTPQTTYYRCNTESLDAEFLVYLFTSQLFFGQLAAVMSQTTRDFVPIREQYKLFFAVPPLSEQKEIAKRVSRFLGLAASAEKRAVGAMKNSQKLSGSILRKAFSGQLVPTEAELARREGRDYETAEQLLTRIKAEREKRPKLRRKIARRTMKEKPFEKEAPVPKLEDGRLLKVLLKTKEKKLTPEHLFKRAGFDEGSIDDFYEELRAVVQAGQVRELRPKKTEIHLEAVEA